MRGLYLLPRKPRHAWENLLNDEPCTLYPEPRTQYPSHNYIKKIIFIKTFLKWVDSYSMKQYLGRLRAGGLEFLWA